MRVTRGTGGLLKRPWTKSMDEAADFLLWVEAVAHRCARQQVGNIIH
jgi:hypothetical protein